MNNSSIEKSGRKKVLFIGYPDECVTAERQFAQSGQKGFELVKAISHSKLNLLSGLKGDIIFFDLVRRFQGRGSELVTKTIPNYYGNFWRMVFREGMAKKVVLLCSYAEKDRENHVEYRFPTIFVIKEGEIQPFTAQILDRSWFPEAKKGLQGNWILGHRLPLINSILEYDFYHRQAKVEMLDRHPLEKFVFERDYPLILRQIEGSGNES